MAVTTLMDKQKVVLQVPQFILEDAAERRQKVRIFCTQPRRLPVLAVSARVAKERNEKLGATVGYHIRLEQKLVLWLNIPLSFLREAEEK